MGSRKLHMLDGVFLAENPRFPIRVAIRHHPENNPGHIQSRVAQTNCGRSRQRQPNDDKDLLQDGDVVPYGTFFVLAGVDMVMVMAELDIEVGGVL